MALMQTPTPAEFSPILPMIPASVIWLIEGLESRLMLRWMRFICCGSSHWLVSELLIQKGWKACVPVLA
jgi:hypothetical protein